jgi:hypothetical protein
MTRLMAALAMTRSTVGGGDDELNGQEDNDRLHGSVGIDHLHGGAGADKLFGGEDFDHLYGEDDDDFLDTGSSAEIADGGAGYDFKAYVTSVNGATYDDIFQGGANNCWVLAGIGAVSHSTGEDLAARIKYMGQGVYAVSMFARTVPANPQTGGFHEITEFVNFDGTLNNADAIPRADQEGESWVVILNRAILQVVQRDIDSTQDPANPHGGGPADSLSLLLGHWGPNYSPESTSAEDIDNWIASGLPVVLDTKDSGTLEMTPDHEYVVLGRVPDPLEGEDFLVTWDPHGQRTLISWTVFKNDVNGIEVGTIA